MKPRIGITCSHFELPEDPDNQARLNRYSDAITDAGGEAAFLWIPRDEEFARHAAEAARDFDGMLISGGADLPPEMYGETPKSDANIEIIKPQRPAWESALCTEWQKRQKPILGICYGCQFLNVWHGGSLIQDVPSEWPNPIPHSVARHGVHLTPDSRLHQIIGTTEFVVESSHHQAVARLGHDAKLTATAPDGVAEAIEFQDAPFMIGVQWHPERDREGLATKRLFSAFVAACRK